MYYDNYWILENICILDSYNMVFEPILGNHCFIIGHHMKTKYILENTAKKLLDSGFDYFNIFGQQANLWSEALLSKNNSHNKIHIETTIIDNMRMVYDLAMLSILKSESVNYVVSDDDYFTEYLVEDLQNIFEGNSPFTVYDWKMFRDGFEFVYNNKDAIISYSKQLQIGFLGQEKSFNSIEKGFKYKLFDGKNLFEIWSEVCNNKDLNI